MVNRPYLLVLVFSHLFVRLSCQYSHRGRMHPCKLFEHSAQKQNPMNSKLSLDMVNRPYWFSFIALIAGARIRHELNVKHAEYDHFPNLGGTAALVRCCARLH